jgi:hypothetical protein
MMTNEDQDLDLDRAQARGFGVIPQHNPKNFR